MKLNENKGVIAHWMLNWDMAGAKMGMMDGPGYNRAKRQTQPVLSIDREFGL
jgi:hypothetical protein